MHEFQTSKNQLRCGQPIQNSRNKVYRASLPRSRHHSRAGFPSCAQLAFPPHTLCGSRFNLTFVPRTKRNPHLDWLTKISTSAAQYLCGVFRCVPLMFLLKRKQNSLCFGISWLVLRVQLCPGAHAVRGEAQFIPPPPTPWIRGAASLLVDLYVRPNVFALLVWKQVTTYVLPDGALLLVTRPG